MRVKYKITLCDKCLDELAHEISDHAPSSAYTAFGDRWYDFSNNDKKTILKLMRLRVASDLCVSWGSQWLCKKHVMQLVEWFDLYPSYECLSVEHA